MDTTPTRVFLVAGERSGDAHGAALMRGLAGLRPGIEFRGWGGPSMRAVSAGVTDWVEEAGVLGLWEVVRKYGWFRQRMGMTVEAVRAWRPDAVVFIDFPGFNLRLAARLQPVRPATRLIYYISPQVWAWNRGRIPRMARMLDRMLCIFPFEKDLYEASGLATEFVGHPLVDELAPRLARSVPREDDLVGWFPGSRLREIEGHFPVMIEATQLLRRVAPALRFVASAASPKVAGPMRAMLDDAGLAGVVPVATGDSRDWMLRCGVGAVASGTATLEAALLGLPYALVYRVAWPTYVAGRMLIRVPYLGIVNLLAGCQLVPEFLQDDLEPGRLARWVHDLARDPGRRAAIQAGMARVVAGLGGPGGHQRAAAAVSAALG